MREEGEEEEDSGNSPPLAKIDWFLLYGKEKTNKQKRVVDAFCFGSCCVWKQVAIYGLFSLTKLVVVLFLHRSLSVSIELFLIRFTKLEELPSMGAEHCCSAVILTWFVFLLSSISSSSSLQSSQHWSLLRLQQLLKHPSALSTWNNHTDLCSSIPSRSLTVVCYENSITQLEIVGNQSYPPLPESFSIYSFFTTLTRLPELKVLTLSALGLWGSLPVKIWRLSNLERLDLSSNYLTGPIPPEISYLNNLQSLILDRNMFTGGVPERFGPFPLLAVLSLRNNLLNGSLPDSIATLDNLRVLRLSANNFSGALPDLTSLSNIQVLDLEDNEFGPQFPTLQRKVNTIVLRKNQFTGSLPSKLGTYYLLRHLDVSSNRFVSPFPASLLNLPSIRYLDIAGNRFTGMLFQNMSCNDGLEFVDLSSNLLIGNLPTCLSMKKSESMNIRFDMNCLGSPKDGTQHSLPFCQTEALAVGIFPHTQKKPSPGRVVLVTSIVGGVFAGVLLVGVLIFFSIKVSNKRKTIKNPLRTLVLHASNGYSLSKLLADTRYISQTMKLGTFGISPYRLFSLEEIEASTNNFESSAFLGEDSDGHHMYRGKLKDDSCIAIRCLKLKKTQRTQKNFTRHIELIVKLRHCNLVSSLGHCFEYCLEDSTISRLFLISEFVPNCTLRSRISGNPEQRIPWAQRISAAIGVAKGIQFLHDGIIPGLFANNLNSTSVLLNDNLVAKIDSYNLPSLSSDREFKFSGSCSKEWNNNSRRDELEDKIDIYDFGIILLEIITGNPIDSQRQVEKAKNRLRESVAAEGAVRKRGIVDQTIARACSNESLRTVIEICIGCLSNEPVGRPSIEDLLWNLQFAAQVEVDSWRGSDSQGSSSNGSISHLTSDSF